MRLVRAAAIEFNGQGTTRFFYKTRPVDDLELLLANKRARDIRLTFLRFNVSREMAAKMDTGVRVNRMLAGALGVSVKSSSHDADPQACLRRVPHDAQLVVFGEEIDDEVKRGLVLTAIVV